MNRRALIIGSGAVLLAVLGFAWYAGNERYQLVKNPDPNHTHADFAVWVNGKQLDFSDEKYMSGSSTETEHENEKHKYLHLHDGIGTVVHRHKPGLSFGEFLSSNVNLSIANDGTGPCLYTLSSDHPFAGCESGKLRLFVNGTEKPLIHPGDADYVFQDGDKILLTDTTDDTKIQRELASLTDDACKYSKTCPWKGDPPTENCIADPEVPCVVQ
jgi:hypothetical protein